MLTSKKLNQIMKKIYSLKFLIVFIMFYSCGNSSEDVKVNSDVKGKSEVKGEIELKDKSEVKDLLGIKGPLEFNSTTFDLHGLISHVRIITFRNICLQVSRQKVLIR